MARSDLNSSFSGAVCHDSDWSRISVGHLDTLKQGKTDATSVGKGNECGMAFEGFKDFQAGDQGKVDHRCRRIFVGSPADDDGSTVLAIEEYEVARSL